MNTDWHSYPIVVLHGWGLNSTRYTTLKKLLLQINSKVLVPDLPGFGKNKKIAKPLYLRDYVDFVRKLVRKHKISNLILIGHSFGGQVALKYTEKFPQTIKKLILTGVPIYKENNSFKRTLLYVFAKLGKLFFQNFGKKFLYRLVGSYDYYKADPLLKLTLKNIFAENISLIARRINSPTLLIWGDSDKHTPLWIAQKGVKLMQMAKLVIIKGADHGLIYQSPEMFINQIDK